MDLIICLLLTTNKTVLDAKIPHVHSRHMFIVTNVIYIYVSFLGENVNVKNIENQEGHLKLTDFGLCKEHIHGDSVTQHFAAQLQYTCKKSQTYIKFIEHLFKKKH